MVMYTSTSFLFLETTAVGQVVDVVIAFASILYGGVRLTIIGKDDLLSNRRAAWHK